MSNTVKKQHYIWRKYLAKWTDSGNRLKGKLYVLRKVLRGNQKRIEFCELEKIGFEKYYYDVTGFQEKDIIILNQLLSHMQEKELVKLGIEPKSFSEAAVRRDFIEKQIMCPHEDIDNKWNFLEKLSNGDLSFYKDSKIQNVLDELQKGMIDAIFCQEDKLPVSDYLNMVSELSQEDFDKNDLKYEFNSFFWMQYFRSPRIHDNTVANIEELKKDRKEFEDLNTKFCVNMVAAYFAERIAINLTQNFSTSIWLFENKTDVPFVTGDTPIINLTGTEMNEKTVFYYPISPKIAIQLMVSPKFGGMAEFKHNKYISLEQKYVDVVKNYNQQLAENCVNEIYSNANSCLDGMII